MKTAPIAFCLAVSATVLLAQSQKPTQVTVHHSDGGPREPRGLDTLLQYSTLVVEGVVESSRAADRVIEIPSQGIVDVMVRTAYRIKVVEAFKAPGEKNASPRFVDVYLGGIGVRDKGSYLEEFVDDDLHPLRVEQTYLLFLKPLEGIEGFQLATERDSSVFAIRESKIVPHKPDSPASSKISRLTLQELRAELRAKGKARFQ